MHVCVKESEEQNQFINNFSHTTLRQQNMIELLTNMYSSTVTSQISNINASSHVIRLGGVDELDSIATEIMDH